MIVCESVTSVIFVSSCYRWYLWVGDISNIPWYLRVGDILLNVWVGIICDILWYLWVGGILWYLWAWVRYIYGIIHDESGVIWGAVTFLFYVYQLSDEWWWSVDLWGLCDMTGDGIWIVEKSVILVWMKYKTTGECAIILSASDSKFRFIVLSKEWRGHATLNRKNRTKKMDKPLR